ncbi:MAG: VOC family protein [Nocardioidaceae bacterium]|nr:VOC family protein [Nocardioidaceae bacterium]
MTQAQVGAWHHSGIVVEDLDAALAYYSRTLGYEVVFRPPRMTDLIQRTLGMPGIDCELAQLASPVAGVRLELLQFGNVPADADRRLPVWPGVAHTAYVVPDLGRAIAEAEAAGGRVLGEVVAFPECRAAYVQTPVGTVVELEEETA